MHSAVGAPGLLDGGITALRQVFGELLGDKDALQRIADLMAGADIRYAAGTRHDEHTAHPLIGRFAPELTVTTGTGPVRLAELVRNAQPLLLDLSGGTHVHVAAACSRPPARARRLRLRTVSLDRGEPAPSGWS